MDNTELAKLAALAKAAAKERNSAVAHYDFQAAADPQVIADVIDRLTRAEAERARMESAILWALGANGDFPPEPEQLPGQPRRRYYWRTELRERAALSHDANAAGAQ